MQPKAMKNITETVKVEKQVRQSGYGNMVENTTRVTRNITLGGMQNTLENTWNVDTPPETLPLPSFWQYILRAGDRKLLLFV